MNNIRKYIDMITEMESNRGDIVKISKYFYPDHTNSYLFGFLSKRINLTIPMVVSLNDRDWDTELTIKALLMNTGLPMDQPNINVNISFDYDDSEFKNKILTQYADFQKPEKKRLLRLAIIRAVEPKIPSMMKEIGFSNAVGDLFKNFGDSGSINPKFKYEDDRISYSFLKNSDTEVLFNEYYYALEYRSSMEDT